MLYVLVGLVCLFAGGYGGYILGARVKAKAEAIIDAAKK